MFQAFLSPKLFSVLYSSRPSFRSFLAFSFTCQVAADRQDGWNQAATCSDQLGLLATTLPDWGRALGLGSAGSVGAGARDGVGSCSQLQSAPTPGRAKLFSRAVTLRDRETGHTRRPLCHPTHIFSYDALVKIHPETRGWQISHCDLRSTSLWQVLYPLLPLLYP